MEMGLGLESKRGALRKLGEAFPSEKLEELLNELHQDAMEQGALDLLNTQIQVLIGMLAGQQPGETPGDQKDQPASPAGGVTSAGGSGVNTAGAAQPPQVNPMDDPAMKNLYEQLNTITAGTKQVQVRNPLKDD